MAYCSQAAQHVKHELTSEFEKAEIRKLHKIEPWKHFVIVGWQFFLLAVSIYGLVVIENPLFWIPLSFVLGFTIFNFTVLLHEVIHNAVFIPSNLARIHKLLQPFYARRGMKAYGYGELFFRYIILNEKPHDDWVSLPDKQAQPPLAAAL